MATPSIAWKNVHKGRRRRRRFSKGCWSMDRVRQIWVAAGSPERITAADVARAGLSDLNIPRLYVLRWCVGLTSTEQAKSLLKKRGLKPRRAAYYSTDAPWRGKYVHAALRNWVWAWNITHRTQDRRLKKVLTLISEFK